MTNPSTKGRGLHVAIIMDGNGRWATHRGRSRTYGHRAGAKSVREVVEAAPGLNIVTLTLYAFSADNWRRPAKEVSTLMFLFQQYLEDERKGCIHNGVRINVIGRRDRLSSSLVRAIVDTERATSHCRNLHLRIAIDYSSREAIVAAAHRLKQSNLECNRKNFSRFLDQVNGSNNSVAEVDLLIRTSGEKRLSDFLLWECAYSEILFCNKFWPDFSSFDLAEAITEFYQRERRFGALSALLQ